MRIRRGRRTAAVIVAAAVGAVAAVAVAAVAAGATPATEPQVVRDHWYVLRLDGRPVGSLRVTRLRHAGDGSLGPRLETRRLTHLRMRRGDETVAMESVAAFVETEDGSPVSAQVAGGAAGGVAWRFVDEGIRERRLVAADREAAGDPGEIGSPDDGARLRAGPAGPWLTPAAADLLLASRIEAGAERIAWRTLDPEAGLAPVDLVLVADGREPLRVVGRRIAATRWRAFSSGTPGLESVQWRSRRGHLLREATPTPAGRLVAELADEAGVRAALAGEPPEVLAASVVEPEGRLDPRWRRARYLVRRHGDDGACRGASPVPAGGLQAVERRDDGWWLVEVDADRRDAAAGADEEGPGPADLASTPLVDAADDAVRRLATRAVAGLPAGAGAAARAEAMRRLVHEHVRDKRLDRLWDAASTAARTRRGDCTEHAVLLAAMLRSADVPARLAVGLVHAESFAGREDVLVWHMWTRAWIDGGWRDLDSTRRGGVGAGHLRLGETAGGDGGLLARIAALTASAGRLEVRIAGGGA